MTHTKIWIAGIAGIAAAAAASAYSYHRWTGRRQPESTETALHDTEELRRQLRDSQDRLSSEIEALEVPRVKLAAQLRSVDKQNQELERRLGQLNHYLQESTDRVSQIDDLQAMMATTAGQIESKQRQAQSVIDGLKDEYHKLQDEHHNLETAVAALTSVEGTLTSVTRKIQDGRGAFAEEQQQFADALAGFDANGQAMADRLSAVEAAIQTLEQHGGQLGTNTTALKDRVDNLKSLEDTLLEYVVVIPERMKQLDDDRQLVIDGLQTLVDAAAAFEASKAELSDEVAAGRSAVERLEQGVKDLEGKLRSEQQEHNNSKAQQRELQATIKQLNDQLSEAKTENANLEQQVAALSTQRAGNTRPQASNDWYLQPAPQSFESLVEAVHEHFSDKIALPVTAYETIGEYKSLFGADQLAGDVWRAIGAMHEYASLDQPFNGNFYDWCRSGHAHAYPTGDVAMNESDTTKNFKKKHNYSRLFYIDKRVSGSDTIEMYAHVKFGGVGQNRPRLFFHDDTRGRTGKMHIGFLGPHNEVKNSRSS